MELLRTFFELCNKHTVIRVGVPVMFSLLFGILIVELVRVPVISLIASIGTYTILAYFTIFYAQKYN